MKRFSYAPNILLCVTGVLLVFLLWSHYSSSENRLLSAFPEKVLSSVVMVIENDQVIWSGSIIDAKNGIILTSKHLLQPQKNYTIQFSNGRIYPLVWKSFHPSLDIALVKIVPDTFSQMIDDIALIDSQNSLRRGDFVWGFWAFPLSKSTIFSQGIISDTAQKIALPASPETQLLIQTDINAVNGFSGGPLVNDQNQIIGVNTAIFSQYRISWSTPVTAREIAEMKISL
jgi:S1-C subfamily serine protease